MSRVVALRTPGPMPKTQQVLKIVREHPEGIAPFQIIKYSDGTIKSGSLSGMLNNLRVRRLITREGPRYDGIYYPANISVKAT